MDSQKPKLLIFDSSALIYRAFYALPPLTDRNGRVVNAVYGFSSAFINILKTIKPSHVVFAFDSPKPTFRSEKYQDYKATRVKAPDDLYSQIPLTKDLVKDFGFLSFESPGFEADDIIGTCVKNFLKKHPGGEAVVATGDLDTLQLIGPNVSVYALSRGINEAKIYTEKEVLERFDLLPEQMNDFKALRGDSSDNIRGVKGIGPKTASGLIKKYQNLENLYEKINELPERMQLILSENKEQAFLSKELVILDCDVPIEINWEKGVFKKEQLEEGKKALDFFSFTSLILRIEKWQKELDPSFKQKKSENVENENSFSLKSDIFVPQTEQEVKELLNRPKEIKEILVWSGQSSFGEEVALFVLNKYLTKNFFFIKKSLLENLNGFFSNNLKIWVFDSKEFFKLNFSSFNQSNNFEDLKIKAYLIQPPNVRIFSFKELAWFFGQSRFEEPSQQLSLLGGGESSLNFKKIKEIFEILLKIKGEISQVFEEQVAYQKESSFFDQIFPEIKSKIKNRGIEFVYREIELPLTKVLSSMEQTGVKIDLELLNQLRKTNKENLSSLKKEIFRFAGREFNLDSPSQLADVLFSDLKISTFKSKKGKSGHFSTSAQVLDKLMGVHPIIPLLLNFREQRKFQTTYLDILPNLVNQKTQRISGSFEQTGTATGRLSSKNPNLQNIPKEPIDKEKNLGLRHVFIAEEGYSLISLDYSQIEIRIVAHLTNEEELIKAFQNGQDIHRKTASLVNKIPLEAVTDKIRNAAKALNFGIIYGMSPFGFAKSTDLDEKDSRIFIENYFKEFPKIAEYMEKIKKFAEKEGFVETIFGRRRYTKEASSRNRFLKTAGERMAINMPIQGTAADIMKKALVDVHNFLEHKYSLGDEAKGKEAVRILMSIHDEIILEVRDDLVKEVEEEIKKIMEKVIEEIIPLKVEVSHGKNWGEL